MPLWIRTKYLVLLLPFLPRKPIRTSFSMVPTLVAGVSRLLRSTLSGVSLPPAHSITEKSVSSVYNLFGYVLPVRISGPCAMISHLSAKREGSVARTAAKPMPDAVSLDLFLSGAFPRGVSSPNTSLLQSSFLILPFPRIQP